MNTSGRIFVWATAASLLPLVPAAAQESGAGSIEEVVVTARKRDESLQDVPIAITAFTESTIQAAGIERPADFISLMPNVTIVDTANVGDTQVSIRGIVSTRDAESTFAYVVDGVLSTNPNSFNEELVDISQIEVLKGPQGSLFGRNTNAGLVKIDTVRPSDERNAYVSFAYGDHDTTAFEAATNIEASDSVDMRFSAKYQRRSDWIDNVENGTGNDFGGFDEYAYPLHVLLDPRDWFTALLKFHGFHQDGSQPQVFYANAIEQGKKGIRSGFDPEVASHDGAPLCAAVGKPEENSAFLAALHKVMV